MLIMRGRAPEALRTFRTPTAWPVGLLAIGGSLSFRPLATKTQIYFLVWDAIGLIVYFVYGSRRSRLNA